MSKLPKTIKGKLTLLTVLFTLIITILMASVSFYIFQYFLERNMIQTTEFSLQLVMDNIEADINELIYLSKWCGSNSTISNYLESSVSDKKYTYLSLEAFDRLKEEYQNSKISEYIKRIMISDKDYNYIQIIGKAYDFYYSDPRTIENLDFFDKLMRSDKTQWVGIIDDPLARSKVEQVIPVIRPIYNTYRASVIGWAYITISADVITDNFRNYSLPKDSSIYINIGNNRYVLKNGTLTLAESDIQILRNINDTSLNKNNANIQIVKDSSGAERTMVSYTSGLKDWSVSQILSKDQFQRQRRWYYMLLFFICFVILLLGTLLTLYLNHIINAPIKQIRNKIKQISIGDFTKDTSIEWDNELGDIGKGINTLSLDIITLMDKRISDEKQKNDLEYQVLLSQVNPHFLYNTLNSIKWMATIQNASGIAEMVTSLASLLKKVAKVSTQFITIKEELSILDDYFLIQKYRYGGSISLEYDIESEDLYHCKILKFALQPLVENAIFHGIEPKGEAGTITVSIRKWNNVDIIIEVVDDGVGMTSQKIKSILSGETDTPSSFFKEVGIANVNNRISYTYGTEYGLSITSEIGNYTKMTMIIPYTNQNKGA